MKKELRNKICDEVEAVFTKHSDKLSAWEIDAVFSELRRKATGRAQADAPKPGVVWFAVDLIDTNLEYALEHYEWGNYAPLASPDGKFVERVIPLDDKGQPPEGYEWIPSRRVLQRTET